MTFAIACFYDFGNGYAHRPRGPLQHWRSLGQNLPSRVPKTHTHTYIFIPIDIRASASTYMYFRIYTHIYTHNMYVYIYYTYTITMTCTNLKVLPLLQCNMPLSWAADPCLTDWSKALSLEKSAGNHGETMVIWEWFSTGFTTLSQCSLWIFSQKPVESGEPMSQIFAKRRSW